MDTKFDSILGKLREKDAGSGPGGSVDWSDVQNKPETFTPSAHNHTQGEVTGLTDALSGKANTADLATVATSGDYTDLSNKPTIPTVGNGTISFTQGGVSKGSFTTNQSGDATIALDAGGGGGAVESVNGQTGVVELDYDDVGAAASRHTHAISDVTNLQNSLDGKASTSHTHSNYADKTKYADNGITLTNFTVSSDGSVYTQENYSQYIENVSTDTYSATNAGVYKRTNANALTFKLYYVSNWTKTEEVVLHVNCTGSASMAFQDNSGNTITPSLVGTPAVGEKWVFLATYSFSGWNIIGYKEA